MKRAITDIHKNAGVLKKYMLTGMSVSCLFTKTSGFPGLLATFILTDEWDGMGGWMGWVGFIFFGFVYFSKTTSYIILIVSGPLRRRFQVSSVKK